MKKPLVLAGLMYASLTLGDALLTQSTPPADAVLSHFAGEVVLRFRGNISSRAPTLVVVDEFGNRVDRKDVQIQLESDGARLIATAPELAPGRYAVRYRVLTEDGLVLSGIQYFTIR